MVDADEADACAPGPTGPLAGAEPRVRDGSDTRWHRRATDEPRIHDTLRG